MKNHEKLRFLLKRIDKLELAIHKCFEEAPCMQGPILDEEMLALITEKDALIEIAKDYTDEFENLTKNLIWERDFLKKWATDPIDGKEVSESRMTAAQKISYEIALVVKYSMEWFNE